MSKDLIDNSPPKYEPEYVIKGAIPWTSRKQKRLEEIERRQFIESTRGKLIDMTEVSDE